MLQSDLDSCREKLTEEARRAKSRERVLKQRLLNAQREQGVSEGRLDQQRPRRRRRSWPPSTLTHELVESASITEAVPANTQLLAHSSTSPNMLGNTPQPVSHSYHPFT